MIIRIGTRQQTQYQKDSIRNSSNWSCWIRTKWDVTGERQRSVPKDCWHKSNIGDDRRRKFSTSVVDRTATDDVGDETQDAPVFQRRVEVLVRRE
jgi:hypothetical protein